MAQRLKYIAEGFHHDSANLLNDFVDLGSVEFSEFAYLWRKHYFSLIFMGRPDHAEMNEFVNEIFRVTTEYLFTPSFYQQVGAVYILYSLFLNQILEPPVKIRLELSHWKIIKSLLDDAILKKYKALHYIIDYLYEHAFVFGANQILKGPLIGNIPKARKAEAPTCNLKATYKLDIMKYSVSTNLSALHNLNKQYVAEKKNIAGSSKLSIDESRDIYEEAINELNEIVNPSQTQEGENVGYRRAKIKAKSFMAKTKNRFGVESDTEDEVTVPVEVDPDYESPMKIKRVQRPRRIPKEERKVGRPRKKPLAILPPPEPKSDDDMDISHLLPQQEDFYLPPINENKKSRTKRDPYYRLSPPPKDSDSDVDMP